MISISVVSHGQGKLVDKILTDLAKVAVPMPFEVILTLNIPELLPFATSDLPYPTSVIENSSPKGFGANHNAALRRAKGEWFCVMNPDIRLREDPFYILLEALKLNSAAVAAPAVLSPKGHIEDSVRRFQTPFSLARKLLMRNDGRYAYVLGEAPFAADWVAGMFMLFRAEDFRRVGGFDESFFLYYEDVDICARLWRSGHRVLACPRAQVIHDAQRASRRNVRYMRWHVASLLRYLGKHWARLPKTDGV